MTKNQAQFQREILRLQRSINRLTNKSKFVQTIDLPAQPKRVTKQMIKKLQALKGKTFVTEINVDTGEIIKEAMPVTIYKRKPKPKKYYPSFSVYDEILARFKEAEQSVIAQYSYGGYENEIVAQKINCIRDCIAIIETQHDDYDNLDQAQIYTAYLKSKEEEIAENLTPLIFDSKEEQVEYHYSELIRILAWGNKDILGSEDVSERMSNIMSDISQMVTDMMNNEG